MNMRNLLYIATILAGILLFSSCEDLDREPRDKFTDVKYWTSESKAMLVVNMAYNQMYNAGIMWRDEFLSDNMVHTYGSSDPSTIRRGQATPSLDLFKNEWKDSYGGIKTCHVFLKNIDRVPGLSENAKNRMIDEIRFIRAFIYFRMTNYYGDIPFFTSELSLEDSYDINRTSKATVMEFIHTELEDILNRGYLPKVDNLPAAENGRITLGAACAFQARAYLYENNYEKVKLYAGRLIKEQDKYGQYKLFEYPQNPIQSYFRLFTPEEEYNREVILDITYVPDLKTWTDMKGMAPITKHAEISADNPTQELVDSYLTMNGLPVKGADKDPGYDENNPYVNRDSRLWGTIVYDNYEWLNKDGSINIIKTKLGSGTSDSYKGMLELQTKTGYYVRKYYDWNMGANMKNSTNIIMFRYADVLLMYAEACNELDKISSEDWGLTIKPIRARAGHTTAAALDYPAAKSKQELQDIIRNERRVELALEGLRWFDIKRWKIGDQVLSGYLHGFKFGGSSSSIDGGYLRAGEYKFNNTRDYLWSVPLSQMDINPNLKPNNPGY